VALILSAALAGCSSNQSAAPTGPQGTTPAAIQSDPNMPPQAKAAAQQAMQQQQAAARAREQGNTAAQSAAAAARSKATR
jgi:hypothetical protein